MVFTVKLNCMYIVMYKDIIPYFIFFVYFIILIVILSKNTKDTFIDEPIDAVYTWVDSTDPEWKKLKEKHLSAFKNETDNTNFRWTNTPNPWDEISISIESVRTYLPWVRNIYVVTHRPQKIPSEIAEQFRVIHVHHDEIFPDPRMLPVFSSHAIETCIHRIPGLAEKFIYFNDDTYITDYMQESDFFNGRAPIARAYGRYTYKTDIPKGNLHNSVFLETSKYLGEFLRAPIHQAQALTKGIMQDAEDEFMKPWESTRRNKFRTETNIIPVYIAVALAIKNTKSTIDFSKTIKDLYSEDINSVKTIKGIHMACFNSLKASEVPLLRKIIFANTK
jgi:hypothetical protein